MPRSIGKQSGKTVESVHYHIAHTTTATGVGVECEEFVI